MCCKLTKHDLKYFPFVSVIIPTYNEETYLQLCLISLQKMNYPKNKLEIIVVDNGSTDKTSEIARKYNTNLILFPEGRTISSVRNIGAKKAQGSVLAFLDADCIVTPDWLYHAVNLLNDSIGVVGSRPVAPEEDATWVQKARTAVLVKESNVITSWLSSANFIILKQLFEKVGGFDEKLETSEDADLSFRLNEITTILYSPDVKAYHLREPKNLLDFFKKELWHGKSVYEGAARHGYKKAEFLSIFVPIIFLTNMISCILFLLVGFYKLGVISLAIFFIIPLSVTTRTIITKRIYIMSLHHFIIDMTYLVARSLSILYFFSPKKR